MTDFLPSVLRAESHMLHEHLVSLRNKRVAVLLNPGNRGDGLIHAGARQLFRSLGMELREIRFPEAASGDELLVHVPGNFTPTDNQMIDQINFYRRNFRRITILPCTVDWNSRRSISFLRDLDDRFTVFARERVTFEILRLRCPRLRRVFLNHDLAFYFDYAKWTSTPTAPHSVLAILRGDLEQGQISPIKAERSSDLSLGSSVDYERLLDGIAPFETVYSDRTHGAIAAAMMGRQTFIMDGSYHKNRSIFEFSLSRFPGVNYQAFTEGPTVKPSNRYEVLRKSLRARLVVDSLPFWVDAEAVRRPSRPAARMAPPLYRLP